MDQLPFIICKQKREKVIIYCQVDSTEISQKSILSIIECDSNLIEITWDPNNILPSSTYYVLNKDGILKYEPSITGGSCGYQYKFVRTHY